MRRPRYRARGLTVCAALLFAVQGEALATLEELLRQTQSRQLEADRLTATHVEAFAAAPAAEQTVMLDEAESRRQASRARAAGLAGLHAANESRIFTLNQALRDKAAGLGIEELFGHARQAAADTAVVLRESLITAQPVKYGVTTDSIDLLERLAASKQVPAVGELQRLWSEIQREMTESGRVVRFPASIVQPDGLAVVAEVVRIGPFTAMAGGRYLDYLPQLAALTVLPRQPPQPFMDTAAAFQSARGGYAPAVVDASRGVLMSLYVERPTFLERIHQGEFVGYVIIAVGMVGVSAFMWQLAHLLWMRVAVAWQLRHLDAPSANNPLGRVLLAFNADPGDIEHNSDVAELRISEAVLRELPKLERFQALLRLAVAAGPLLGLIGTVIGMIITFQSITEAGSSDPKLMARGISQAMIATVLGLGIAIPLLFANAGLATLSRTVVQVLDEQSAGLLAENIEKRRHA